MKKKIIGQLYFIDKAINKYSTSNGHNFQDDSFITIQGSEFMISLRYTQDQLYVCELLI